MARYAIGDVQGCLVPLERLLDRLRFDPASDELWFVGDLVNRGPGSLGVLRFVKQLGSNAVTVLGNHDLHLLAISAGVTRPKPRDTLDPILSAPDRAELIAWLQRRPLLHVDAASQTALVHAGVLPAWTLDHAQRLAREVETQLTGPESEALLRHMYGNAPNYWSEDLRGYDRWRVIINSLTRMRFCDVRGGLDMHQKGAPGTQPAHLMPWYDVPGRRNAHATIVFGHWSTLGVVERDGVLALDTGCVWGGELSAVRLDDGAYFRVNCPEFVKPG